MLTVVVVVVLLVMMMRMLTTMMLTMTTVKGSKADSVWKEQQTKRCERGVNGGDIERERARIISSCSSAEAESINSNSGGRVRMDKVQRFECVCSFVVSLRVQNRVRFLCLLFTILLVCVLARECSGRSAQTHYTTLLYLVT